MKVCVVGGGGREHAIAHSLARTAEVVVTPGSPMIDGSVSADPMEIEADLFVIGPEAPLVDGLADQLRASGRRVFGPGADGAVLEGSKEWMKKILSRADVPTARYQAFGLDDRDAAVGFLRTLTGPYVVKTDGLAAGKGVLVTDSFDAAVADVDAKLSGESFGAAGQRIVIEEFLDGPEISLLAICDGKNAVPLAPAQDFKRAYDGDEGPNTGGMGAYSPVPAANDRVVDEVMEKAIEPTLWALRKEGIDYRGVLYAGLMLTGEGPKVLEYNIRFGDPESQVVLPRVDGDLADLLAQAAAGKISDTPKSISDAMVTVVCATENYPGSSPTGDVIEGLDDARSIDGVTVFAAGVGSDRGKLVTAGGRILSVTGQGPTVAAARDRAYAGVAKISWPGMRFRSDIAANPT